MFIALIRLLTGNTLPNTTTRPARRTNRARLSLLPLEPRDVPSGAGTADDPFTVHQGTRVALPSVVPAGSGLRAVLTDGVDHGTLSFSSHGASIAYRPAVGRQDPATGTLTHAYTGSDSFEYQLRTAAGDVVSTQRFHLRVTNGVPTVASSTLSFTTTPGVSLRIPLDAIRAGVSDPNGDTFGPVPVSPVATNAPTPTAAGGRAWIGWGSGISYNPPANFTGTDSFTYLLWDRAGYSTPVTVAVDVGPTPTVSVDKLLIAASEGSGYANVVVNLSRSVGVSVNVQAFVTPGTADASDYGTPQVVTFLPGETQKTIRVPITNDTVAETTETFAVSLGMPTNAALGTDVATEVWVFDDETPVVSVTAGSGPAGEDGLVGSWWEITRLGDITQTLSVSLAASGTAAESTDYAPLPDSVIFEEYQSVVLVGLTPRADNVVEAGGEVVRLTVDPGARYTVGNSESSELTIADDPAEVWIDTNAREVTEGGSLTVTFRRAGGDVSQGLTVLVQVKPATGDDPVFPGTDFAVSGATQNADGLYEVVFAPGAEAATLVILPVEENTDEPAEWGQIEVVAGNGYVPVASTTEMFVVLPVVPPVLPERVVLVARLNVINRQLPELSRTLAELDVKIASQKEVVADLRADLVNANQEVDRVKELLRLESKKVEVLAGRIETDVGENNVLRQAAMELVKVKEAFAYVTGKRDSLEQSLKKQNEKLASLLKKSLSTMIDEGDLLDERSDIEARLLIIP